MQYIVSVNTIHKERIDNVLTENCDRKQKKQCGENRFHGVKFYCEGNKIGYSVFEPFMDLILGVLTRYSFQSPPIRIGRGFPLLSRTQHSFS